MNLFLLVFLIPFTIFGQYSPESLPNPTRTNGSYVSNPDGILDSNSESKINKLLIQLEQVSTVEFSIVILNSIGDHDSKDFAVKLFEKWGIGKKDKNNGLLLLIALKEKRWEFETGYGLEGVLTDIKLASIGRDLLVPSLKSKDYETGLTLVIQEISNVINHDPTSVEQTEGTIAQLETDSSEDNDNSYHFWSHPNWNFGMVLYGIFAGSIFIKMIQFDKFSFLKHKSILPWGAFFLFAIVPILVFFLMMFLADRMYFRTLFIVHSYGIGFLGFYLSYTIFEIEKKQDLNHHQKYLALDRLAFHEEMIFSALFFPIPVSFVFPYVIFRKKHLRFASRTSPKSGKPLKRLSEEEEDQFLQSGQKLEEELKSVDYDVWVTSDHDEIYIFGYDSWMSKYSQCTQCKLKTNFVSSEETIVSATYSSSGSGSRTYRCKNCSHTYKENYIIPKLEHARESSSSSSSGSSSSSSSFGGGRSGGGGAGGSW
jgi:uncharacterized protein